MAGTDTAKNEINIFLTGNPNCGKTSLFNAITGEKMHVGNWPGVTVSKIVGIKHVGNTELIINDLPGTYSLTPATPEEKVVLTSISEAETSTILNVIDTSNLERNLFLTTQFVEVGILPVGAMNCFDSFESAGGKLDLARFTEMTGLHVFPTVARTNKGTEELIKYLAEQTPEAHSVTTKAASALALPEVWKNAANEVLQLKNLTWENAKAMQRYNALSELIANHKSDDSEVEAIKHRLAAVLSKNSGTQIQAEGLSCQLAADRYKRIDQVISAAAVIPAKNIPAWQEKLDKVLTNKYLGLPLFVLMMGVVFWTTFTLGAFPMEWLEGAFGGLKDICESAMSESLFKRLIIDGLIEGVGGVLVFLPNILILFFWIAMLEDSGYMSRAAFIMDRVMSSIGLQGRAFIPMIMGIGCNVPAIMAVKIIESKFQQMLTIMLIPLVTCSARLPVLVLLCAAFFPENPGKWMFILFFLNILVIMFIGQLASLLFKHTDNSIFILEMPPYRLPTVSSVFQLLYEKASHFVVKAGTVILAGSILIWALTAFPRQVSLSRNYDAEIASLAAADKAADKTAVKAADAAETENEVKIKELTMLRDDEMMEKRYMAQLGKFIHPVMAPLGFSWRETVALIPGFLAKEAVVSTLEILYRPFGEDVGKGMKQNGMTPLTGFVFMLFTLLYVPCLATVGIVWRETSSFKFLISSLAVYFGLAYAISYASLKIGSVVQTYYAETDWSEGILLAALVVFAAWYLIKMFVITITGKKCSSCAKCRNGSSHNGCGGCC